MPVYKFHVFNDDNTVDQSGRELADDGAARRYALSAAAEIMGHDVIAGRRIDLSHWIQIEDERGEMTVVPFGEAITIAGQNKAPGDIRPSPVSH